MNIGYFWTDIATTVAQIPNADRFGVPGNVNLINFLFVLTFGLHFIFMNLTVGGVFVNVLSHIMGKDENNMFFKLKQIMPTINGVTLSFTITFGIAPLLFIQVIYGHLFYTVTILMAYIYVTFFIVLLIPYIFLYSQKLLKKHFSSNVLTIFGIITLVALFFVMLIFVAVSMAMLHPEQWMFMHEEMKGIAFIVSDKSFIHRYHYMIFSSIIGGGIMVMLIGWFKSFKDNDENYLKFQTFGGKVVVIFSVIQVIFGYLTYKSLDILIKSDFNLYTKVGGYVFMVSVLLTIASAVLLIIFKKKILTIITTLLYILSIYGFAVFRDGLRHTYLRPYFKPFNKDVLTQSPDYGSMIFFFIVFIAGLFVIGYMIKIAMTLKPIEKEENPLERV